MGIAIHFRGHLQDTSMINSLIDELAEISEALNWKWQVLDEDWSKPASASLSVKENEAEISGHLPIKGINIKLHPDCEALSLYFDSQGRLTDPMSVILEREGKIKKEQSYCIVKTQFAPPDVHISIIKLLKYLKKRYIHDLEVIDEGEYWESENTEELIKKIALINDNLDRLEEIFFELNLENCYSEQLTIILEKNLKKRF
ncbi:MAG: hypothetical protein ACE5HS_11720 [bacterium]